MSEKINDIIFCPEVGGSCLREGCVAYTSNLMMEIVSGNMLIKKISNVDLDYNLPMTFSLQVGGCSKFDKIVDKESFLLFEEFKKEIGD